MKYRIIILLMFAAVQLSFAQMVPDDIIQAFEKGNARQLAEYFNNNIEMEILGEEYVTSKNQAARILQDFFKKHPPVSFKITYEGVKKDSKYGLGTLKCRKDTFHVNLYFMEGRKEKTIYFLSIEKN